jgi:hypothetical protein
MKIELIYLHISGKPLVYVPFSKRFFETYLKFPADCDHELTVALCNGATDDLSHLDIFGGMNCRFERFDGGAWDIPAQQHIARKSTADLVVCMSSLVHFRRRGWLKRVADEFEKGGCCGLYGAMSSFEIRPHIRTCFYACSPDAHREYPHTTFTRESSFEFESGETSFTNWFLEKSKCMVVTWDGCYPLAESRAPSGVFRKGDQHNCIAMDRHTEIYDNASPEERLRLETISHQK